MAGMALSSLKARQLLTALLIFTMCLGTTGKINFVSYETYRGPDRGFEVTFTDLIAVALFASMLVKQRKQIRWVPPNSIPVFLFFLWAVASCCVAPVKLYAAFALFKFVRVWFIYFVLYNIFCIEDPLPSAWSGFVGMGIFVTLIGLRQKYLQGIYRIPGPFDHSNTIPLFLNLSLSMQLLWVLVDENMPTWKSALTIFSVFGMLFCVAATFSRAGTAFAVGSILAAICMAIIRTRSGKSIVTGMMVFVLLVAGGIKAADSFLDRIKNAPKSSEEARDEFNMAADHMARDHVFGVGLNNFSHVLTTNETYREYIQVMANEEQAGVCHHIYRLMAAEMGKTGLVLFLIVLLRFAWIAFYGFITNAGLPGLLQFGIFLGYGTLHASGFLEWAFRITSVMSMFFAVSAFSAALSERAAMARAAAEKEARAARPKPSPMMPEPAAC